MKPFIVNRHGRLVFPCNFFPEIDFSVFDTLEHFMAVITRDFGEKAPTESVIAERLAKGRYATRYDLCRDLALNLFWVNRYTLTLYEKRPTRWGDLPRYRDDVFLSRCLPWDAAGLAATIDSGFRALPAKWDKDVEDQAFQILLNGFQSKPISGTDVRAIKPTIPEILADPTARICHLREYNPDYPGYSLDDVIDYGHDVPELEALMRQAMILHNQYRWDPEASACTPVSQLREDDCVLALYPRNPEVLEFIRRVKRNHKHVPLRDKLPATLAMAKPTAPYPPIDVRKQFHIMPRVEGIATYQGEVTCTNADVIRNTAYCWSKMTETEIEEKTGIRERRYTELEINHMALIAAREALTMAKRRPAEIGAVLFCTCTAKRLIPSNACWVAGELGIMQAHACNDIIAACAGMSYGISEAIRLLQEVNRPILVICAEKFSDKCGTVRTSRMLFGDGAAAMVIAPAPEGAEPDIEYTQTYASGPWTEVNSILWPNPEFGNSITVYGPEVKSLAERYLKQMMGELKQLPHPQNEQGTLFEAIDLVVPHQANKNMVVELSQSAGFGMDRMYFNIDRVGNTSAASILMAIKDAVVEGRIDKPMRVFAPGFGAGAVGGYVVMRVDPAIVSRNGYPHEFEVADYSPISSLEGRVALVTGASRGIGRAIAVALARRGAAIAINYRSDTAHAESVAQEIRDMGVSCILVQGDIGVKDEAHRIVAEVIEYYQRLDILVNNAGITRDRTLRRMTDDEWDAVISVNLNGTFHTTHAALPHMINQRYGRIINISSVVGQAGAFGQANYSASKGGMIAFTKTVALESARYNITANTIAPGYTDTDMLTGIPPEIVEKIKKDIPLGRFATPEEVAKVAVFLAADGDYITGQELNVNGGFHM